jgi:ligand-binding sensor domain-containing protein/signal transduction histidine kinase
MSGVVMAGLLVLSGGWGMRAEEEAAAGRPVLGKNADGYLEVFKVEADGKLLHRWQKRASGDWSSWASLGGVVLPGIAVVTNSDGRMEVFGVKHASLALGYVRQAAPNSVEWSGWKELGGTIRPPVTVERNAAGMLEVFALEAGGDRVKHLRQTNATGGWAAWEDLGGSIESQLTVARNRDGRLEVFGIETGTHQLVHLWQQRPQSPADWSEWGGLGGTVEPGFAVGQNVLGRLEVFAVTRTNNGAVRICQSAPGESLAWTGWQDFSGQSPIGPTERSAFPQSDAPRAGQSSPSATTPAGTNSPVLPRTRSGSADMVRPVVSAVQSDLAIGQSADGRLEVFAVDARERTILHRWETMTDGSDRWSAWASMGESAPLCPAVGQNEDGNLEVFALDVSDGSRINHRRQISRASDWLDWSSLDLQSLGYSTRTWQTDEGLPDNVVAAITQTQDGYLWVGTRAGLARFDGINFTCFDTNNTPALHNSSITALCRDRKGKLWIGTDGGGVACLAGRSFSHYGQTNGLAGDRIRAIYERKDGSVWIGTTAGLTQHANGACRNYTKKQGLLSDTITSLYEDGDGNLWIATGEGLNRLQGESMVSFAMPNRLPGDSVRGICQDKGGRVWIGSNNGMLWYSWYWTNFYAYNTRYGLSDTFVSTICEDHAANLWVGTYSGLNRFREGRFFPQHNNEGAPFAKVNALFEDREGNLWVGSVEGLVRLAPKRFFTYTRQQGLTHNHITSVLEDRSGSLWVGTWGGGLNQLQGEKVTAHSDTNGFSDTLVLSITEGYDGSLWVGADYDGGVTRLKDGNYTRYTAKDGLINAPVRVLHEDRSGNLWIGTSRGLSCLRDGKFTNYTVEDHLGGGVVRAICEDHAGKLWIGTEGGLSCRANGRFTNLTTEAGLSANAVTALYEDKEHDLWVGTRSGGLNRYRRGRITAYTTQQGLFSDEVLEILEDDQGWLWMSCSKGVFRVRKRDLDELDEGKAGMVASVAYGKNDGMESAQCSGRGKPAGWKTRDGRLWFPTTKGLIAVDPKTTKVNPVPPAVYIEQLIADRKAVLFKGPEIENSAAAPGSDASAGLPADAAVRIPPGRGELEFHFTTMNLQAPESSRFKYWLEGIDSDWVEAGTRRTANYNNVYPGDYRFRVVACNKDGAWNLTGASLAFVLRPHYWQTWWWRGLLALVVVGGAGGTALYVTRRRMQRKLELFERRVAIERERGRIAKDIHDDLGSSLTRIMMLGERAEEDLGKRENLEVHIGKIVSTARRTVQALDEIVWAVNPDNDTFEGLVQYISHYADEFLENTNVRCRLEMPEALPTFVLPAEVRHDLFLVVKEAFNNILKHSHATEVRVRVSADNAVVAIEIADNGSGFDPGKNGGTRVGNGLANMRKRIQGLGGELHLTSAPSDGTKLSIKVNVQSPLKPA